MTKLTSVYAVFEKGPAKRVSIPLTTRNVLDAVRIQIGPDTRDTRLVGVLNQTKTKWID